VVMKGTIVKLRLPMLGNDTGTKGICYDIQQLGGQDPLYFYIFANGNYDGFDKEEREEYLENVCMSDIDYEFTHVMQLGRDFYGGCFASVWES